jgi:hypothetical protein
LTFSEFRRILFANKLYLNYSYLPSSGSCYAQCYVTVIVILIVNKKVIYALRNVGMWPRVARWFVFRPKIPIRVNFGGPNIDWKMLIYFMAIWNILWPFVIFYDHLVHFVFIWYIFPFLVSCTKKHLATLMWPRRQNTGKFWCGLSSVTWTLVSMLFYVGHEFKCDFAAINCQSLLKKCPKCSQTYIFVRSNTCLLQVEKVAQNLSYYCT